MIVQCHTSESLFFVDVMMWIGIHIYDFLIRLKASVCAFTRLSSPKTSSNSCSWYPLPYLESAPSDLK